MARPPLVDEQTLLPKLTEVFRRHGYAGTTLKLLAQASGLKQASLYHRFPGGKAEIAGAILNNTSEWLAENVLQLLHADLPPRERIRSMAERLEAYYADGTLPCPLNVMVTPGEALLGQWIKSALETWRDALVKVLEQAGVESDVALRRSERALALIQGSLVLAIGMQDPQLFRAQLADLPDELLGSSDNDGAVREGLGA